ncbi:hypothetical protein HYW68_01860 [Candidatus Parcubacteria bacterium]|nr:hypothetical protein [Candidatus Parcubacteria bacterium]
MPRRTRDRSSKGIWSNWFRCNDGKAVRFTCRRDGVLFVWTDGARAVVPRQNFLCLVCAVERPCPACQYGKLAYFNFTKIGEPTLMCEWCAVELLVRRGTLALKFPPWDFH